MQEKTAAGEWVSEKEKGQVEAEYDDYDEWNSAKLNKINKRAATLHVYINDLYSSNSSNIIYLCKL
jgi:hypothetical protein